MKMRANILAFTPVILGLVTAQPIAAAETIPVATSKARMATLFSVFDDPHSPGCSYAVRINGKTTAQASFGSADVSKGRKLAPDIPMNIGSVSKSFTAATVLTLIRAGKIKATDTVAQHFPDLPDWAKTVTIADLIHMRSGIPDFLERPSDGARVDNTEGGTQLFGSKKTLFDQVSLAEIYDSIKKNPALAFKPGAKFNYSNVNYTLLAMLVEKVTGLGIEDYLRSSVLPPTLKGRVQEGRFAKDLYSAPDAAMGYYKADGGKDWLPRQETWDVRGPSSIFIRVTDLAKWGDFFSSNLNAKNSFQAQATTPGIFTEDGGERAGYAYGLIVTKMAGEDVIYHPGGTEQFTSGVYTVPAKRLSFAYSCNIRAQELVAAFQSGPAAESMKAYGYDVVFRTWMGK